MIACIVTSAISFVQNCLAPQLKYEARIFMTTTTNCIVTVFVLCALMESFAVPLCLKALEQCTPISSTWFGNGGDAPSR